MRISLDTETTGLDFKHGAKPYIVTICDENDNQIFWEWDVNPLTRQPIVPSSDLEEIQSEIDNASEVVLQNAKFDVEALFTLFPGNWRWPWHKTRDTLFSGHLLNSLQPHDLTSMVLLYLDFNVHPYEEAIKEATKQARREVKSKAGKEEFEGWRTTEKDAPDMPSAGQNTWKTDMWLPKAIAKSRNYTKDHLWHSLCLDYANSDSVVTLHLYEKHVELLKERELWNIYVERLKLLPIVYNMQMRGITLSGERLESLLAEYKKESAVARKTCWSVANRLGCELKLPKSGNNKSLLSFVFGEEGLGLDPVKVSKKTGNPSLDKECKEEYLATLPEGSEAHRFMEALQAKSKRDTAINYMISYEKFWLSTEDNNWYCLYPSLNPTGTNTLRWSSQNPNEQNISKKEGFNLRYAFGPAPGREWWSCDAKNIELRLPAYESGEQVMIDLFEKPDEPPYYGSNHLLVFSILHPKMFAKYGADVKKEFASTWYQWTKNGNFAVQYGAVESSGTADRAYHVKGAQRKVAARFKKIAKLNQRMINCANEYGYVETMPDITVDAEHGYPLYCERTKYGRVKPTIPLNYHIQGTAMWWMAKAMVRCQQQIDKWNVGKPTHEHIYMIMQVHDELVFDFPCRRSEGARTTEIRLPNYRRIKKLMRLMEKGGDDIGVPTPVSCEYHSSTWSEGESL